MRVDLQISATKPQQLILRSKKWWGSRPSCCCCCFCCCCYCCYYSYCWCCCYCCDYYCCCCCYYYSYYCCCCRFCYCCYCYRCCCSCCSCCCTLSFFPFYFSPAQLKNVNVAKLSNSNFKFRKRCRFKLIFGRRFFPPQANLSFGRWPEIFLAESGPIEWKDAHLFFAKLFRKCTKIPNAWVTITITQYDSSKLINKHHNLQQRG